MCLAVHVLVVNIIPKNTFSCYVPHNMWLHMFYVYCKMRYMYVLMHEYSGYFIWGKLSDPPIEVTVVFPSLHVHVHLKCFNFVTSLHYFYAHEHI